MQMQPSCTAATLSLLPVHLAILSFLGGFGLIV